MKSYRWTFVWRKRNGLLAETQEHRVISAIERPMLMQQTIAQQWSFRRPYDDCVPQVLSRERV